MGKLKVGKTFGTPIYAGRWFGLDEEGGKIICVEIKGMECTLTVREHPSDVWSPPKKLHPDTITTEVVNPSYPREYME